MTRLPAALLVLPVLLVASDGKQSTPRQGVEAGSCDADIHREWRHPGQEEPEHGEHEPRGFEPVACLSFRPLAAGGTVAPRAAVAPGWRVIDDPYFQVVRDSTAPGGDRFVARALFPAGWTGGRAPIWASHSLSQKEFGRLFISFRVKLSENWQGHPVNDKILYAWIHEQPVVFPVYRGVGHGPLRTEVRIQGVPEGARNLPPNIGSSSITRGEWHHWEILLQSNTPGLADGEIDWWVDGEKIGRYADVRISDIDQETIWEIVSWRPVWGGRGGIIEEDQYMWMDDLYVSGAP